MSDTPETDAAWNAAPTDDTEFANAGWAFARELERERNRAMEQRLCECSFEDACRFAMERDALRKENRKLRESLNECREDSIELLCERDWWKNEPRGNHRQAYEQIQENICRADELLKDQNAWKPA